MPAGLVRPRASQVPHALRGRPGAPTGVWLAAGALLGRPCPVTEPYPHICGLRTPSGARVQRRGCAACGEAAQERHDRGSGALAPVDLPAEDATGPPAAAATEPAGVHITGAQEHR